MDLLTDNERRLLLYIKERIADHLPPTVREICRDLGIKSTSSAHRLLKSLQSKGYIDITENANRSIRLVGTTQNVQVPLLGVVTAGAPILAFEDVVDYIPFPTPKNGSELFALRVKGDSMIEAAILDGDIAVVSRCQSVENGTIAVVLVGDEATVKRFYKENGHYRLQPENSSMEPIIVDECSILGKVVSVIRMYE